MSVTSVTQDDPTCVRPVSVDGGRATEVVVYVRGHDRASERLLRWLAEDLRPAVRVVDVEEDAAAAAFVARLSCCGQVTPAVEVGGLILFAPGRRDVVDAVRRHDATLLAGRD
jgi:hypothetical protein